MERDAIIIGAGPAGYVCAIRLAQEGRKVAVVDRRPPGGTCLNIGCIPSKALIRAGRIAREAREAGGMGLAHTAAPLDLEALKAWMARIVGQVTEGVRQLFKLNKVALVEGTARIEAPGRVRVALPGGGEEVLAGRAIAVATGAEPVALPGFPFAEECIWSSTEALSPPFFPRRLVVVGAGVIGLELGLAYHNLGAEVTLVEALDGVLPGLEADLRKEMGRSLKKRRIPLRAEARALGWEESDEGPVVRVERRGKEERIPADAILITVGRKPTDGGTGLDGLGVARDAQGFVEIDKAGRTSVPGIWAIGDLTGEPQLAHKGSAQGLVTAAAIAGDEAAAFAPRAIPWVVFTDPEIAVVGLTGAEAAARGLETVEGRFPIRAMGRAATLGVMDGFVKVVAEKESGRVVGCHIMAPEASELIAAGALAVEQGLTARQLAGTIQAHPTIGEALPEAAELIYGPAIHLFDRRRPRR